MKTPALAALAHSVYATKKDVPEQKGKLTTYHQVASSLLAAYATDEIIAGIEARITKF